MQLEAVALWYPGKKNQGKQRLGKLDRLCYRALCWGGGGRAAKGQHRRDGGDTGKTIEKHCIFISCDFIPQLKT